MARSSDSETNLPFPILVGDIGGTNARFALLVDAFAEPKQFPIVQTADFANIDEALQTCILDRTSVQPRSAFLDSAGAAQTGISPGLRGQGAAQRLHALDPDLCRHPSDGGPCRTGRFCPHAGPFRCCN